MLLKNTTINQDIVKKKKKLHRTTNIRRKNTIHCILKCRWSITKAKRHHLVFTVALMSAKGSLMYVIRVHTYLMKALSKIKFRDP